MIDVQPPAPEDEFYVGYEERMPAGLARWTVRSVAAIAAAAALAVTVALLGVRTLPPATFEFGVVSELTGILRRMPYPNLEIGSRRVWLVGRGKFGAARALAELREGVVTVRGSRIQRGRHEMLEVHSASQAPEITLTGEIVDSKCFLGVMNPAEGTVHRDCATRCLHGGITPMLIVRGRDHREELVVLVSADGRPAGRDIARLAGRAVRVTGRLARSGADYIFYASRWKEF